MTNENEWGRALDKVCAERDVLKAALDDIARQQHPWEMEETAGRDFEYAYNEMIRVARKALQKWEETQNDK